MLLNRWHRTRRKPSLQGIHRGRSKHRGSFGHRPTAELLEDRRLLSAFYDLTTIASTANGSFTQLGDLVSVNSIGDIAFVGSTNQTNGIYVAKTGGTPTPVNINPSFSTDPLRDYGRAAAISDDGMVSADERRAVDPTRFAVRVWDSATLNSFTTVTSVPDGSEYTGTQTFTDIDEFGHVAYVTQSSDSAYRQVQLWKDGQSKLIEEMPGGAQPSPRPVLTTLGVVYYSTRDKAIKLNDGFGKSTVIASPALGFNRLGVAPGASDTGDVIVFTGDRGNGPGVFAAYRSAGKYQIVRIAGEDQDSFVAFDPASAVAVGGGTMGVDARAVEVGFVGTRVNHGTGLYTAQLSFFGSNESDYDPTAVVSTLVSGIAPVAEYLDTLPDGKRIDQVRLWHGMDQVDRGRETFWVQTTDGTQEILRADPKQVVRLDFSPADATLTGHSKETLDLLSQSGISNFGVTGTTKDALAAVGLSLSPAAYDGLQTNIVNAVQKLFDDAGARVLVVGRPGEAPLSYIPEPVIDARGKPVTAGGAPELSGAYKTVFVGLAPSGSTDDLGVAAPTPTDSSLDFYNQVEDSTAFVFVNNVMNPAYFNVSSLSDLTPAQQAQGIAFVIAHETGHLFGLYHLDEALEGEIMHAGTINGELGHLQKFDASAFPVQPLKEPSESDPLSGVQESSAARLRFATNTAGGDPPNSLLVKVTTGKDARAKLALPSEHSMTVHDLIVGVKGPDDDLLPAFYDLGGGDLASLLASANVPANADDTVIVLGSTDGQNLDVVSVAQGQEGAQTSLVRSVLGIASDSRVAAPVSGANAGLHFYHLAGGGADDLGMANIDLTPPNQPPVLASIANQTVDVGTLVSITLSASDADAGQQLTYSLDPGAPIGATIDAVTGAFAWTPPSDQAGQAVSITVRVTDDGVSPASATQTFFVNVTNRLRVTGVTWITPPATGALQVAIDFNEALQPASTQNVALYHINRDDGTSLPIQSAVYSDNGMQHRVTLTVPAGTAVPPAQYSVNVDGANLVAVNGDRASPKVDQAWVNAPGARTLDAVALGADGSLQATGKSFDLGNPPPTSMLVGDYNGDGVPDLVVSTTSDPNSDPTPGPLLFFAGKPDGTYDSPRPIAFGGSQRVNDIWSADWNGDGKQDLIAFVNDNAIFGGSAFFVLLNDGNANFSEAPDTPIASIPTASGFYATVVDVTGDGLPEIVEWNNNSFYAPINLLVIGKDPFLGYGLIDTIPVGADIQTLSTADLNGDGKPDFITSVSFEDVGVMLSTPTGYAPWQGVFYTAEGIGNYAIGDFDGDGKVDIAVFSTEYNNSWDIHDGDVITLLKGDGHGDFAESDRKVLGRIDLGTSITGDFNGDGRQDFYFLVGPSDGVRGDHTYDHVDQLSAWTLFSNGQGGFDPSTPQPMPLGAIQDVPSTFLKAVDLNNDGATDIFLGTNSLQEVAAAINDGYGTFHSKLMPPLPNVGPPASSSGASFAFGDFNSDGVADFVAVTSTIDIYLGQSDGGFTRTQELSNPLNRFPQGPVLGDLNHDGVPDLLITGQLSDALMAVYLGNGDGTFRPAPKFLIDVNGYGVGGVTLADVNNDGNMDAVITVGGDDFYSALGGATQIAVCFGDGTGKLTYNANTLIDIDSASLMLSPVIGDFDKDGMVDLIVGRNGLHFYHGLGNGKFIAGSLIDANIGDGAFAVADFNGDGNLDLLGLSTLRLFKGDGHGGFQLVADTNVQAGASATVGDFNGDGKLDVAEAETAGDGTLIFLGDGTGHFAAPVYSAVGAGASNLTVVPREAPLVAGVVALTDHSPVATDLQATDVAGHAVAIGVAAHVSDADGEMPRLTAVSKPAHGTALIDDNGTPGNPADDLVYYTAFKSYTGSDTFNYTIADTAGVEATATITVSVTAPAASMLQISASDYSVGEGSGVATITVTRTGSASGAVSVQYSTTDGTAGSADYTPRSGTLSFASGETSKTFAVTILDDNLVEDNEFFNLVLTAPTGGASLGNLRNAVVTIIDNDNPDLPPVASDDFYDLASATSNSVASASVLANDSGPNLTAVLVANPSLGAVSLNANGSFSYQPGATFWGVDSFTYKANNGTLDGNVATVTLLTHNALQVKKLYDQVLHRDPELSGWEYWTRRVNSGTASLGTIASGIFESPERIDPIVSQMYRDYLFREADSSGLTFWRNMWQHDGGPDNVVAGIVSSPEFFRSAGNTNSGWVAEVYRRLLHREAESSGLQYWTGLLNDNLQNRSGVILGFEDSPEDFHNLVKGWYIQYLDRAATTSEEDQFVAEMLNGTTQRTVQIQILDGVEYRYTPPPPAAGTANRLS